MATNYVFATFGDECRLTRKEFLTKCEQLGVTNFVSKDDEKKGLTVDTPGCDIGCDTASGICWANFGNDDKLSSLSTYSDTYNGGAAYALGDLFGFPVISEHDDEFSKYDFGIDITATAPHTTRDGWNFYLKDGWLLPHHIESEASGYYGWLGVKLDSLTSSGDWDKFMACLHEHCS